MTSNISDAEQLITTDGSSWIFRTTTDTTRITLHVSGTLKNPDRYGKPYIEDPQRSVEIVYYRNSGTFAERNNTAGISSSTINELCNYAEQKLRHREDNESGRYLK